MRNCAILHPLHLELETALYKALSGERSPDFDTILKVVGALGLKLHAEAAPGKSRSVATRSNGRAAKRRAA